jgi:hypothetical protein
MSQRQPLPQVDPARVEFGFERTVCACDACIPFCRHIPGYLVPADLERWSNSHGGDDFERWASQHLLASPGALVVHGGKLGRIRTLVPARRENGSCVFLTAEGRCSIHALAPFGCAFFDAHQSQAEADRRSQRGLRAVLEAWQASGPYARLWQALHAAGRDAPLPAVARYGLRKQS